MAKNSAIGHGAQVSARAPRRRRPLRAARHHREARSAIHRSPRCGRAVAIAGLTFASAALTAALSRLRTWVARAIAGGTVGFSILLIQMPGLARLLHMQPLHWDDWGRVLAASALPALLPLLFPPRD